MATYLILALLAGAVVLAVRAIVKGRGRGCCAGCSGNCRRCGQK